jgi:Uma2 family endonuclease
MQLVPQLPEGVCVIQDVDIDLGLVPADQPGLVRRPDLVVVDTEAVNRVDHDGGLLSAGDVLIVVEIVSPGSHRLDYLTKRGEYADAGIPRYWIVDLDKPVSLLDCHLAEDFGYADSGAITGVFTLSAPFSVRLALDLLT